jgi:Fur family transcriptional regulator, iron response regulator
VQGSPRGSKINKAVDLALVDVRRSKTFHLYFNGMQGTFKSEVDVFALLRKHRINPTRQRVEIARALFSRPGHWPADAIFVQVNELQPATSKATVYNTLNLFVERGLIREVIARPNKVFYDANTSPHHHFYDVDTGRLTDIAADAIALARLPDAPPGTVAEGIDIVVRVRSSPVD